MVIARNLARLMRTPVGISVILALICLAALAVLAPTIWGEQARALDPGQARQGSSLEHLLGTDDLGRDVLARTLVATQSSLAMALAASGIAAGIGFLLGGLTGVARGRVRSVLMACIDWSIAFPPIIVALFVSAIVGPGWEGAVLATGIAIMPSFARVAQTLAAEVAGADYFAAAQVVGVNRRRILTRYLIPNIAEPLVIQASVTVGVALVAISALSFLGLGVQAPDYDWGRMLSEGLDKIFTVPVVALAPATAIVITGLTFSQLGDVVARAVQPSDGSRRRPARRHLRRSSESVSVPAPLREDFALAVRDLTVEFDSARGTGTVVDGVDISLRPRERIGIVGESGSGKTMTALALSQLLPDSAIASMSRMDFMGHDLLAESPESVRRLLGLDLAIVFQDPGSSLNPVIRVGKQLSEAVRLHRGIDGREAHRRAVGKLEEVHVPAAEQRAGQYPHEFSGGMRQRAMIAMGLMGSPSVILADEPTTALDVTVQAQIIDLLREINEQEGATILLITHDIGVVAEFCQRVIVMYAGRIIEDVDIATLLSGAAHPYTRALMAAVPDLDVDVAEPLVTIPGRPPGLGEIPSGCAFAPRCAFAVDACSTRPPLESLAAGHLVACWRADEVLSSTAAPTREDAS